ncbi:MAG: hypothetical protein KAH18_12175 [Psychromonas sp.]|nr:hypothetical protein [Psychromonas sp.]
MNIMRARKHAGQSALRFFKEIVSVRSPNLIHQLLCNKTSSRDTIRAYRNGTTDSIIQAFENAAKSGIGQCREKADICYLGLSVNPTLIEHSTVMLCQSFNIDHVFVLITDKDVENPSSMHLCELSQTTMIVDGWTEDWHFPNLDLITAYTNHLGRIPNPAQLKSRLDVKRNGMFKLNIPMLVGSIVYDT